MTSRFTPSLLHNLETFMAVAAEGSFSGAARRLGITQPSVSEQVRALELHFQMPLFERLGRETRLSAAGERVHDHAERLLLALEEMERDLQGAREGAHGVVAIAASPVPGEAVLPALLPLFQSAHPRTSVREVIADARTVVERLLRREVELAVIGGPFHDERCVGEVIARDEFALIAPRNHPLAELPAVTAERLAEEPLVLREEGSSARAAIETAFAAAGIPSDRVRVVAELGSTEAVKAAVAAGLGVGFVSVAALVAGGPAGVLRALPMADFAASRDLLLVAERGRPLSTLASAFHDFLLSDVVRRKISAATRLPSRLRAYSPNDPLLEPPTPEPPAHSTATKTARARYEEEGQAGSAQPAPAW
jgi:DNA-binding transcriptional LysR family regulator